MIIFAFIFILAVIIYVYSFNNRDRNLDYKLTPQYQKSGYDDKLRTDIIKGLEITIKKEVINNFSDKYLRTKAIENLIDTREATFYINIESLSQQHKISHNATFDAIFSACNYTRLQFGIPSQSIPSSANSTQAHKVENIPTSLSDSYILTKKQKLSCAVFLGHITHSSYLENPDLYKLYSNIERKQLKFLGLSMSETNNYLETIQQNHSLYKEILRSLNDKQKDFLVSMAIELLWCDGKPSEEEYIKFEKSFAGVVSMNKDEFAERILKLNGIMN